MNGSRCRGQSGLTIIELLIVVALAAIVLGPVVGVAYVVMKRSKPTEESAEASKQLRMFRTVLADDWASASEIVINPQTTSGLPATYEEQIANCGGSGYGGGPIRIALVTSYTVSGWPPSASAPIPIRLRILYREKPNPDGTVQIRRQVCQHKTNEFKDNLNSEKTAFEANAVPGDVDPSIWKPTWRTGGRTDESWPDSGGPGAKVVKIGSNQVLMSSVRGFVIPPAGPAPSGHACNPTPIAPFVPCDMSVTVIGVDGDRYKPFDPHNPYLSTAQRSTLRLHQMVGPMS